MFKSVCISLFLLLGGYAMAQSQSAPGVNQLLEKAADQYSKRNYDEAVILYETLLKQHQGSADLHYNLGNSYFKCNRLAPAILQFEKALRLDPSNEDARFNLQLCNARIVDQLTPLGKFMIARWYQSIGLSMSSNGWAMVSLLCFLIFASCLIAYFLARRRWQKKTGFYLGITSFLICILALTYSWEAFNRLTHSDEAILFALSVTVKSSPDGSGNDLFVLHEGTKVKIRSVLGDWSEIELVDGNVGWLPSKDIEII
jgi:tetratricopeptide (TPR) repeat protein